VIDWSADEGETPDHLDGEIKFSNVEFAYPTRTDIQVCLKQMPRQSQSVLLAEIITIFILSIDSEWP
jgi:hypothetical protein